MADQADERLRRAWQELNLPGVDDAYERPDEQTQRAIDWLRSSWSASAPEAPAEVPWRVRLHARTLARASSDAPSAGATFEAGTLARWAAAAVLFLAASLWLHSQLKPARSTQPHAGSPSIKVATIGDSTPERTVVVAAATPEHTELRSGPVRLLLLPDPIRNSTSDEEPR